ncbi:MAG: thiamine phosphate synthase [Synergistaceae bacterium]
MRLDKRQLTLYAITNRNWLNNSTMENDVEKALRAGVTILQIREKNITEEEYIERTQSLKKITEKFNVPLIVNDNIEVAIKSGADGVHLGQDDINSLSIRERIGEKMILGVSAHNVEEAKKAEEMGANYLGVGAVFSTSTKNDAENIPFGTLKEICDTVSIPVVAIGGITKENIKGLIGSGISGISVISAIFAEKDIEKATKEIKEEINKIL